MYILKKKFSASKSINEGPSLSWGIGKDYSMNNDDSDDGNNNIYLVHM